MEIRSLKTYVSSSLEYSKVVDDDGASLANGNAPLLDNDVPLESKTFEETQVSSEQTHFNEHLQSLLEVLQPVISSNSKTVIRPFYFYWDTDEEGSTTITDQGTTDDDNHEVSNEVPTPQTILSRLYKNGHPNLKLPQKLVSSITNSAGKQTIIYCDITSNAFIDFVNLKYPVAHNTQEEGESTYAAGDTINPTMLLSIQKLAKKITAILEEAEQNRFCFDYTYEPKRASVLHYLTKGASNWKEMFSIQQVSLLTWLIVNGGLTFFILSQSISPLSYFGTAQIGTSLNGRPFPAPTLALIIILAFLYVATGSIYITLCCIDPGKMTHDKRVLGTSSHDGSVKVDHVGVPQLCNANTAQKQFLDLITTVRGLISALEQ
eukprot:g3493.t1